MIEKSLVEPSFLKNEVYFRQDKCIPLTSMQAMERQVTCQELYLTVFQGNDAPKNSVILN